MQQKKSASALLNLIVLGLVLLILVLLELVLIGGFLPTGSDETTGWVLSD